MQKIKFKFYNVSWNIVLLLFKPFEVRIKENCDLKIQNSGGSHIPDQWNRLQSQMYAFISQKKINAKRTFTREWHGRFNYFLIRASAQPKINYFPVDSRLRAYTWIKYTDHGEHRWTLKLSPCSSKRTGSKINYFIRKIHVIRQHNQLCSYSI